MDPQGLILDSSPHHCGKATVFLVDFNAPKRSSWMTWVLDCPLVFWDGSFVARAKWGQMALLPLNQIQILHYIMNLYPSGRVKTPTCSR